MLLLVLQLSNLKNLDASLWQPMVLLSGHFKPRTLLSRFSIGLTKAWSDQS